MLGHVHVPLIPAVGESPACKPLATAELPHLDISLGTTKPEVELLLQTPYTLPRERVDLVTPATEELHLDISGGLSVVYS